MTDQPRDDRPHPTAPDHPDGTPGPAAPPWAAQPGATPQPAVAPQAPQGPATGATPTGTTPGTEHTAAIAEPTRELPAHPAPQPLPPTPDPVWAQTSPSQDPAFAPRPAGATGTAGSTGATGATGTGARTRPAWLFPVALGSAVALVGGGIISTQLHDDRPARSAAVSSPSASSTSQIGANTAPAVDPGSTVAPDWTKTAAAVTPSVVSIDVASGTAGGEGSGVVIDGQGHVVSNNHVVSGAGPGARITVTLSDQRAYSAKIVGTDPSTDLAVIKIDGAPNDLKAVSFGDSSKIQVGQPVMAVGNPLGLSGTVTTGIVSALNRPVTTSSAEGPQDPYGNRASGNEVFTNAIQTSAAINPGNSGGALVDAQGRLIGINSSIASLGQGLGGPSGNIGIGFAIPVNEVSTIAKQLIATGKAEHAYLGVAAPTGIVRDGDSQREAAVIQRVYPSTPADAAGLKVGDAIVSLDGSPVTGYTSLISQVFAKSVGDKSTIEYVRDGKRGTVQVTFTKRPAS